jgi:hypothetical protein
MFMMILAAWLILSFPLSCALGAFMRRADEDEKSYESGLHTIGNR